MKKNHFLTCSKTCTLALAGAGALFLASCAEDGYDDETFASAVRNSVLASPSADDITVTASADGKTQTFAWPVVHGAGGYLVSLYITDDMENPVVLDSLVDGCSMRVQRQEDTNYQFNIKTVGSTALNNQDAPEVTTKLFDTFAVALATIPSGTDLCEYFAQNPVPDSTAAIYYNLEGGGHYTLPDTLDFAGHHVILRSTDKQNRPTITYGEGGQISTSAPMTLQNLNFDCSAIPDDTKNPAAITLSLTPDESIKAKTGGGNYYNIMTYPIYLFNCDFEGLKGMLFYDNNKAYCVETMLIENCKVHFTVPPTSTGLKQIANLAYVWLPGGFIKDFTIKNSTLWNTGEANLQYFLRYNNSGRIDRAGYDKNTATESVNHLGCTFYNLAYGWWANYSAFAGQPYTNFDIENNIFVECGTGGSGIARRLLATRPATAYGEVVFLHNTYWTKGAAESEGAPNEDPESPHQYDTSHSALQTDPALVSPATGDLTPTGAEQLQYRTGDPFWLQ